MPTTSAHLASILVTVGLAPVAQLAAQQPDLTAIADTVFHEWNSTHTPGCAVGIERNGDVLLERGYGMADLETGTPITPHTILESGSVAKQFTAAAVLLLAQDGKLSLDDTVQKYLPELPRYDRPMTIRHLLTHTSGLRDWSSLVPLQGWPRGERAHTQAYLLDLAFHQKAINYPVGDYYSYTNTGFALAEAIVERVSGESFQQFTHDRIFAPLGMTHTQWRDDFTRLVPGRAQAYARRDGAWHLDMPFEDVVGPGGLLSTVGDWLIWNDALTKKTLGAALVDTMTNRMVLTSGRRIDYGKGLFIDDYRGVHEVYHSGSTAGYSTFLVRWPDRGLSIAILCNAAGTPAGRYAHQLADRLITDFPPAPPLDTTKVDAAQFARFIGMYRNERTHEPLHIEAATETRLRALPDDWYWYPNGSRWHFDLEAKGTPSTLRIAQSDGDTVRYAYAGLVPWRPTAQQLQTFVGRYYSGELSTAYEVRVAQDTLTISMRAGLVEKLIPTYPDGFEMHGVAVWFTRDRKARVTAMHFGESRVWDLVVPRSF
jgi:CubicO group peptidase (beta-lactamase class C family)